MHMIKGSMLHHTRLRQLALQDLQGKLDTSESIYCKLHNMHQLEHMSHRLLSLLKPKESYTTRILKIRPHNSIPPKFSIWSNALQQSQSLQIVSNNFAPTLLRPTSTPPIIQTLNRLTSSHWRIPGLLLICPNQHNLASLILSSMDATSIFLLITSFLILSSLVWPQIQRIILISTTLIL